MSNVLALVDTSGAAPVEQAAGDAPRLQRFVTFWINGETFAIALAEVEEIIPLPPLTSVPKSPSALAGIANLQGAAVPAVNLRRVLGVEDAPFGEASRMLVVRGAMTAGLIVDRVAPVMSVAAQAIKAPFPIASSRTPNMMAGVIRGADGVVMVLSPQSLLANAFSGAGGRAPHPSGPSPQSVAARPTATGRRGDEGGGEGSRVTTGAIGDADDARRFVVVYLDDRKYALPLDSVAEVIRVPDDISAVPRAPDHLEGLVNISGVAYLVINARVRLGLGKVPRHGGQRVVVLRRSGETVGILVDTVAGVLSVGAHDIKAIRYSTSNRSQSVNYFIRSLQDDVLMEVISADLLFGAGNDSVSGEAT